MLSCGSPNADEARFCHSCGASLLPAGGHRPGARKTVTILFSDVVGSTPLAERLDPVAGDVAGAVRILSEGQQRMEELGVGDFTILPFLANALYMMGDDEKADSRALQATASNHPLWGLLGRSVLAKLRARQGRAEAAGLAEEAVASFEGTDFLVFRGKVRMDLAEVLDRLGRAEAATQVERALRLFEQKGALVLAEEARSRL